jgi:peroxiredoxin
VLLEELKTAYATNGFKRSSIIRILNEAAANGRFKEQREIAKNLVYMLTRYQSGKPAPDFALPDSWGDTIRLSSYRNKIVYLHFFTTWNTSSLEEMQMMRKLYEKYSGNVQFISICCDRQYMKLYHFSRENTYPWPMLHFNNDYDLLESFGVKTYPYFILIDEKGNFLVNPSESPSGNIEARFLNVLKGGK